MKKLLYNALVIARAIVLLIALSTVYLETICVKETIAWFAISIILTIEIRYLKLKK